MCHPELVFALSAALAANLGVLVRSSLIAARRKRQIDQLARRLADVDAVQKWRGDR